MEITKPIMSLQDELNALWKEKTEIENIKASDDEFEPAHLAEPTPDEDVLVRIIL